MLCVYYRLGFICGPRVVQGGILCTQDQSVFLRFHVEAPLAALFVMWDPAPKGDRSNLRKA